MMAITDGRKKMYMVLGMHHSATSFISKALVDQGVDMGSRFNKDVPLYEDMDFVELNEKILVSVGGNWICIPSEERTQKAFDAHREEAIKLLSTRMDKPLWGWKDPRNSILAMYWLRLIEELDPELDVYVIAMFRDPKKVARSLSLNPYGQMLGLSDCYNEIILETIKDFISHE